MPDRAKVVLGEVEGSLIGICYQRHETLPPFATQILGVLASFQPLGVQKL
jgi:hypothetical protein